MSLFAKKIFAGKLKKSKRYLSKIFNLIRCCIKKFLAKGKSYHHRINIPSIHFAEASYRGSVLIEFAIWMPLLIILLFYIFDLMKMKRYYSQTEFVGQQIANIIQNISNKSLTKEDFKKATAVAWLTMFPGGTLYEKLPGENPKIGYVPGIAIYYVKGTEAGVKCHWKVWSTYEKSKSPSSDMHWDMNQKTFGFSIVKLSGSKWSLPDNNNSNLNYPTLTYPSLDIKSDDCRVIIETVFLTHGINWKNPSGQLSAKQKYGFYLVTPRINGDPNQYYVCFNSITIFAPKSGLFSEKYPPSYQSQ